MNVDCLLYEFSCENINHLAVRRICKDNPGLISSNDNQLRIQVWTLLLLGSSYAPENSSFVNHTSKTCCDEYNILLADVKRTRQDLECFKTDEYKAFLVKVLNHFCLENGIMYKQGMNDLCAVFLHVIAPSTLNNMCLIYDLYSAFMLRYMERYCCSDSIAYLQKSLRLFQLLLEYHDPVLACHFIECDFYPELYAPNWFLTLFPPETRALNSYYQINQ